MFCNLAKCRDPVSATRSSQEEEEETHGISTQEEPWYFKNLGGMNKKWR